MRGNNRVRGAGTALVLALVAGCTAQAAPNVARPSAIHQAPSAAPDIVLVLMDDFSMDLLQTMRHGQAMQRRGATYRHSFVVDSLCCVSRASLMTGQYPHQTGVLANTANLPNPVGPVGGWEAFRRYGNLQRSVNVRLQQAGYTTGFVGKYLNEYLPAPDGTPPPTPPGWTAWNAIMPTAYDGWGFESTHLDRGVARLRHHPRPPLSATPEQKDAAYVGTVTQRIALDFIRRHRTGDRPYFLQVSTYGPHSRVGSRTEYPGDPMFPPAFRDRRTPRSGGNCGPVRCRDLTVADLPGYADDQADNVPIGPSGRLRAWKTNRVRLSRAAAVASLRNRARMVQSIDRMLGRILAEVDDNTVVILTSDNGFHTGQHRLERGKGTPYDSDVRVPLIVTGPGIPAGVREDVVSNIDLAPTLEALAGLTTPAYRSGQSFLGSLRNPKEVTHDYAFFEHTWAPSLGGADPDRMFAGGTMDLIPSYVAVRGRHGLLVRFDLDNSWSGTRFGWEYYDYRDAGFERRNSYADPGKQAEVARLKRKLREFLRCSTTVRSQPVTADCRRVTTR